MNDTETNVTVEQTGTEEEKQGKFYTEEEIALIEQKAGDKRISQYQKTLEKKQRESERLRNMSDEDKREYSLSQREQAIAEKEAALAMLENKSEGIAILADKGLDTTLIELVLNEDADVMYDNIKNLEKAFKKSVKAEVESRLASKTPTKALGTVDKTITKQDFNKMTYAQRLALRDADSELYDTLSNM